MSDNRKTAFITGASSGLGKEFAWELAARGYDLILSARSTDRLSELRRQIRKKYPSQTVEILTADLTHRHDRGCLQSFLEDKSLQVVINNAGFGKAGCYRSISTEEALDMDLLNVAAMNHMMQIALTNFHTKGKDMGYLLNVASSAGLMPAGPYMSQYYATKAYVASLSRGVARELLEQKSRICIDCLCPGPVDTAFNKRAGVRSPLKGISPSSCIREALLRIDRYQEAKDKGCKLPPSKVIVPGIGMKAAVKGSRFLPDSLLIAITSHQQKKKLGKS